MNDVMERLRAADPVAGGISTAEQREADALLTRIVGSPAAPDGGPDTERLAPARRRGLPRVAFAVAGLACAVLIALAVIDLGGSDTPAPAGAIDKAVAATTQPNTIYHVLERATASGIPSGGPRTFYFESWNTTNGRFHRKTFAARGERRGPLVDEIAGRRRPGRQGGPALRYQPRRNEITPSGVGSRPVRRAWGAAKAAPRPGAATGDRDDRDRRQERDPAPLG